VARQLLEPEGMLRAYAVNAVAPVLLMGWRLRTAPPTAPLRIVNLSSVAAVEPFPGLATYGSTKAALRLAGMVLAAELDMRAAPGSSPSGRRSGSRDCQTPGGQWPSPHPANSGFFSPSPGDQRTDDCNGTRPAVAMITIAPSPLEPLLQLRDQYRAAVRAQIVHDSWHRRARMTLFRIQDRGHDLGYAALGAAPGLPHDTLKEFYLLPDVLPRAAALFEAVLTAARPRWLEAQTNDPFLAPLLDRFAPDHRPHTHLFAEGTQSALIAPGPRLRRVTPGDHATVFAHTTEPIGEWGLDLDGALVATGGIFYHYNPPYGDVYMEVAPGYRRRGFASYLVQELKRICRESGHVPAARCGLDNPGSRGALERAGMVRCGQIVRGAIATSPA